MNNKKFKIIKSESELNLLLKSFSWEEVFEMFTFDEGLLAKALAMARSSTALTRDKSISAAGFNKFFSEILIFF